MYWESDLGLVWPNLRSRIEAGRGLGSHENYRGWLGKREKPGKGTFGSPLGLITNRQHQMRSLAAENYLFMVERLPGVDDIRELLPILDMDETLRLCGRLGIEHEYGDSGADPEPFLIDFVITRRVGDELTHFARSLCSTSGETGRRETEQHRLLHAWCKQQEVDWRPVDTSGLSESVNRALSTLRAWHRHRYVPEREIVEAFVNLFRPMYKRGATLGELIADISAKSGESVDRCFNHFYYSCWARYIDIDLREPLVNNRPVILRGPLRL